LLYDSEQSSFPSDRFLNPELSWLSFNERVLQEAQNSYHPLLERLKFLSISADNFDEFYMVRVAGIKSQVNNGLKKTSYSNIPIVEQLEAIHTQSERLIKNQHNTWKNFIQSLKKRNIDILTQDEYSASDTSWLNEYFENNIIPNLHIATLTKGEKFPLIPNLGLAMCLFLTKDMVESQAIINIHQKLERFIQLPALRDTAPGKQRVRFVLLEDVLNLFKDNIIGGFTVTASGFAHVIRDSELDLSDKADDLLITFEAALKQRSKGEIIRLAVTNSMPESMRSFLIEKLELDPLSVVQGSDFLSLNQVIELCSKPSLDRNSLKYRRQKIRFPERINDFGGDCFAAIDDKDIVVHHPYESFDVVVKFLQQAAEDPYVTEIKQTLYRIGPNNAIVEALIRAAKAGKDVTVVVELKARFDEAENLGWGKELQDAGARVIYGIPGLKIHAKMSLVNRRAVNGEDETTQTFVHFGTGNYHPQNAQIYSDLSFFTCAPEYGEDARAIFHFLEGYAPPEGLNKLSVAPFNLREDVISLIEDEIGHAQAGKPGHIWLKMNSLADKQLIDKLYEASCAGVQIELIVRGVCCIRPGIKGLSENINVSSIIGRFLEHSRIYCFGNGRSLPSTKAKVFIGPTDWIKHKLDRRIEMMIPIETPTVHEQILGQIMQANIKDKKQCWELQPDGTYIRHPFTNKSFSAHEFFLSNPSLSGRGSALRKAPTLNNSAKSYSTSYTLGSEVAVLDIGSNSVRLVIYDGLKRSPLALFNEKVSCQLGKDIEKTGNLNVAGVQLAYQSIERFAKIIRSMQIKDIICFATSAVRDAKDGDTFVRNIEKNCNIKIQVLTGKEESQLAALGIASAFYYADGVVGDLGGGSLELAHIAFNVDNDNKPKKRSLVEHCTSFPIGVLRLKTLAKGDDAAAVEIIDQYLNEFPLKETLKDKTFFAIGGGFRTLAKVHLIRKNHPLKVIEQYNISPRDLLKTIEFIKDTKPSQLKDISGISSSRAPTIRLVGLIFERLIKLGSPKMITFSTHGVREGILFNQLTPFIQGDDALIAGCADMIEHISPNVFASRGGIATPQDKTWVEYGEELYKWISPALNELPTNEHIANSDRLHLAACILSRLAWHEERTYRAEMSFRWILDSKIPAMDHQERVIIATALFNRYQSREDSGVTRKAQKLLTPSQVKHAITVGKAMRLGYQLSGGSSALFEQVNLRVKAKSLILSCSEENRALINSEVRTRLENLAKALDLKPEII
jgi:polyphosphate kinase